MTEGIARIPQLINSDLREWLADPSSITRLRNFASFVAQEETFSVRYKMQEGARPLVEQKVLCITKSTERGGAQSAAGAWTRFFEQGPRLN
jgi:hypothetical protein